MLDEGVTIPRNEVWVVLYIGRGRGCAYVASNLQGPATDFFGLVTLITLVYCAIFQLAWPRRVGKHFHLRWTEGKYLGMAENEVLLFEIYCSSTCCWIL